MTGVFQITIDTDLKEAIDRLQPEHVLTGIVRGMAEGGELMLSEILKSRILRTKGPFPVAEKKLGRVTGQMRTRSSVSKPTLSGNTVTQSFGSDVRYWAPHEFGFDGPVSVRSHSRQGKYGPQQVRSHSRRMRVPKREPMMAGIRQHADRIYSARILEKIVELLSGKGGAA